MWFERVGFVGVNSCRLIDDFSFVVGYFFFGEKFYVI